MKIQVIGLNLTTKLNTALNVDYTTLNTPNSLDEYDINIINLQNAHIWKNNENSISSINNILDLNSLSKMVQNSNKSKIIIALPQNYTFEYDYRSNGYGGSQYFKKKQLKDMLFEMSERILPILTSVSFNKKLCYENTHTICEDETFDAAFYFDCVWDELSLSNKSEKKTTIVFNNVIYTTLNICNQSTNLDNFLTSIKILSQGTDYPKWLYNLLFNDDEKQMDIIDQNNNKIEFLRREVEEAEKCLEKNMRYKSILFNNGNELVDVVFEILEILLGCDLSDFKDEKNEDFLIKLSDTTFIGEIKGVTSNVKNEHISQVDNHCQLYVDKLQENGITENIKQILIINPFRTKDISNRDEVHENQIKLAKRNECLVITTETLLYIFERFLKSEFNTEYVIKIFTDNIGILTKEMLIVRDEYK